PRQKEVRRFGGAPLPPFLCVHPGCLGAKPSYPASLCSICCKTPPLLGFFYPRSPVLGKRMRGAAGKEKRAKIPKLMTSAFYDLMDRNFLGSRCGRSLLGARDASAIIRLRDWTPSFL